MGKILGKQKKSLKIMYFKNQYKSCFHSAKILPAEKLRNLKWAKKIWKSNNKAKPSFDWFEREAKPNPRENGKYLVPLKRTLHGKNTIFCLGFKIWNKIPIEIRKAKTLNSFCKKYKEHLLLSK